MQKYKLYIYFDISKNDEDGWVIGNKAEMKTRILLPDDPTDEDIYGMLKNVGYYIEYIDIARDKDRIEMTAKVDGEPLGFLKRIA